ncbi:MAG: YceI family protein [Bacteroidetes bacterium]|nr:YceI family protein [Bacteroidota bacterium]MBS1943017.1 YceI family protein [Bacteroidota bacterium]
MNIRSALFPGTLLLPTLLAAQTNYATRTGEISFFSSTPMEDITAVNRQVASVFAPATGAIEFSALIKAFAFEKAMMQEHFNENYMESNTFPKAIFKGKVHAAQGDDLAKAGEHAVTVAGDLTIHGITKQVTVQGVFSTSADGTLKARSEFQVKPEDYGIKVPGVVRNKIAEIISVKVQLAYKPL